MTFNIRLVKVVSIATLKEKVAKEKMQPYDVCFQKGTLYAHINDEYIIDYYSFLVSKSFQGDTDIAEVSLKFSLRCPLSLMRIELPIKGKDCKHIQVSWWPLTTAIIIWVF